MPDWLACNLNQSGIVDLDDLLHVLDAFEPMLMWLQIQGRGLEWAVAFAGPIRFILPWPLNTGYLLLRMEPATHIQVIKCGGSVLRSDAAIAQTCDHLVTMAGSGNRLIVVVSAPAGVTDSLFKSVPLDASTSGEAIAEHVSSGERAMAARLTEQLRSLNLGVTTLSVHDIGLRASGPPLDADPVSLDVPAVLSAAAASDVVVVPGFVGVGSSGARRLLGRGGSDISAIFIAAEVGGTCCLLQRVAGIYETDPDAKETLPAHFAQMHWDDMLELEREVVQHKAVRLAQQRRLCFQITSPRSGIGTLVGDLQAVFEAAPSSHASS